MAGEIGLSDAAIIYIPAAMTFGALVTLLVVRRPPRRCTNCDTALPSTCDGRAACNRRAEERELQRAGN